MFTYQILIPAYNAASTMGEVLEAISCIKSGPQRIIVVDDGSEDETSQIAASYKTQLLVNKQNMGKGYSLLKGFRYFLNQSRDTYLLCMDADLQHPVDSIPRFIQFASENDPLIVIGNRSKNIKEMPPLRIISNRITSFILSRLTGQEIKDGQCGFRLIHRSVLQAIELFEAGFQLESEFIISAARKKFPIQFLDIPTIYNHENSNIRHLNDTYRFSGLILKELFR